MRIYLVSEEFPEETNYGWIWTYHFTLSWKLVNLWHEVTIICKSLNKENRYKNNLWVNVLRVRPFFWLNNLFLYRIKILFVLISEQIISKIDIIESPEWNWEIFFYSFINFIWKTKIVLRLHTPLFVCKYLNNIENSIWNTISIYIEKYLINKTKYITCCSHSFITTRNAKNL